MIHHAETISGHALKSGFVPVTDPRIHCIANLSWPWALIACRLHVHILEEW
jgi:hypothetical protein